MASDKQLLKRWRSTVQRIQNNGGAVDEQENYEQKQERIGRAQKDYNYFVQYYFPHLTKNNKGEPIACAPFHIKYAKKVKQKERIKAIVEWGRGLAKSTHFDIFIPLWLKIQDPRQINTMLLIGNNEKAAQRLLQDLQAELQYNERYIHDFGQQLNAGSWEDGDFTTADNAAFIALGMGQKPRGARNGAYRPDFIVCDDLDDDKVVRNPARVREYVDWLYKAVIPTMDIGLSRFFLVNNRMAKNSILATVATERAGKWEHWQVNALDNYNKPAWPEKYTKQYYNDLQEEIGWKAFETEYMNKPVQDAGRFKLEHIQYKKPYKLSKYERIVAYFDPSFRSGKTADYKAVKVWGKIGSELHCLYAFVRQCEITDAVKWLYDFHQSLPQNVIVYYKMEGRFIQRDFLEDFELEGEQRGWQLPIQMDNEDKGNKEDRIESIIPYWERGMVYYNDNERTSQDMITAIDQTLAWDRGSNVHDDGPDADHGAIKELMKFSRSQKFTPKIGSPTKTAY